MTIVEKLPWPAIGVACADGRTVHKDTDVARVEQVAGGQAARNERGIRLVGVPEAIGEIVPTSVNCNRSCAPVVGVLLIVVTPPVTFARSQFVPAVPSVLIVLFSQLKIEPLLSVRPLVNVSVPGLLPGAKVPPACTVTAPPIVPEAAKVAPLATVVVVAPNEPVPPTPTINVPALTFVAPV